MLKVFSIACFLLFIVGILDEKYASLEKKLFLEFLNYRIEISLYVVPLILIASLFSLFLLYRILNSIFNRNRNNELKRKIIGLKSLIDAFISMDCLKFDCLNKNIKKTIELLGDTRIVKLSNAHSLRCQNMNNAAIGEYYEIIKSKNKKDNIYLSAIKGILELKKIENFSIEEIELFVANANSLDKKNYWANEILLYFYQINGLWHKAISIIGETSIKNMELKRACLYASIAKDYTAMNNYSKSEKYWNLALQNSVKNLALINEYCNYLLYHDNQIKAIKCLNLIYDSISSFSIVKLYFRVIETSTEDQLQKILSIIKQQIFNKKNEKEISVYLLVTAYIFFIQKNEEEFIQCLEEIKSQEAQKFLIGRRSLFVFFLNVSNLNDANLAFERLLKEISINDAWICTNGCSIVYREPKIFCNFCKSVGTIENATVCTKSSN